MGMEYFILFCATQTILLLLVFLRKKLRTIPNLFLSSIFVLMLVHYGLYYAYYSELIDDRSPNTFLFALFGSIPPVVIYFYSEAMMNGRVVWVKRKFFLFLPVFFNGLILCLLCFDNPYSNFLSVFGYELLAIEYIAYSLVIIAELCRFYQLPKITFKVFQFNREETKMTRLLVWLLIVHGVLLLFRVNIPLIYPAAFFLLDILNLFFLLLLSYLLTYVIISEPKVIQRQSGRVGLAGFKKYSKSKLTREKAAERVEVMNRLMEDDKPYLDSEFSLRDLADLLQCTSHDLSEILNGYVGQTFNDYINNYRIEEFKRMARMPEYRHFTILAMAFEVGFKSKATFNVAFKKFTGQTPSQFLRS